MGKYHDNVYSSASRRTIITLSYHAREDSSGHSYSGVCPAVFRLCRDTTGGVDFNACFFHIQHLVGCPNAPAVTPINRREAVSHPPTPPHSSHDKPSRQENHSDNTAREEDLETQCLEPGR